MTDNPLKNREIIFELRSLGPVVKVTAVDVKTMTECSIQGPASAGDALLKSNALKRLEYVLKKKGLV